MLVGFWKSSTEAKNDLEDRVPPQNIPIDTAMDAVCTLFGMADILRRAQGNAVGAFGLHPSEHPYRIIGSAPYWRLRDYGDHTTSHSLLIVAAPIKRPYLWDLAPSVSAIGYCLRQGLHVYLLEWLPASRSTNNNGLDEYADAIAECIANVTAERRGTKPFLIGHSLGGTLAAIYAATAPTSISGLALLGAPLCFQPKQSQFRDMLVSLVPSNLSFNDPFPGSLLSQMSAMASPGTFIWSRMMDAGLSLSDPRAMEIYARIERWTLDEIALPGKLVHEIIDWLYRENRLCRGILKIGDALVDPSHLSARTLAIVNTADEIAPLTSLKPFTEAMPAENLRIIEYRGEVGVCLQHLGILVGREARAKVWPEIISWFNSHG
jgi:polyhydroxyalkanoate synthase subunit PhaC